MAYENSPDGIFRRWKHKLKFHYKITPEQYEEMFKNQHGNCGSCDLKETRKHHLTGVILRLAVDHCHKTDKIRGLLCSKCNTNLGHFGDDLNGIMNLVKYLEKSNES